MSRGSALVHTSHWHPIMGIPALVPVPRNNNSTWRITQAYRVAGGKTMRGRGVVPGQSRMAEPGGVPPPKPPLAPRYAGPRAGAPVPRGTNAIALGVVPIVGPESQTMSLQMRVIAIVLLLGTLGVSADSPTSRPAGASTRAATTRSADAVLFNGHYYKVFEADLSWHEKKKRCEEMGGYLACIETAEEQKFIAKLANGRYLSLGATDEAREGQWKWVNGAAFKYTAWFADQPNNYGADEHYLATYDDGQWVDVGVEGDDFWMPTGFICEWDR